MVDQASIITADRYFQGKPFHDFVAEADEYQEYWQQLVNEIELDEDDRAFFTSAVSRYQSINILAVGAYWCEDSLQAIPIAARIAGEIDGMMVRVFNRDAEENSDLKEMWRKGERSPIPKIVFFNEQMQEIGHMIERPAANDRIVEETTAQYETDEKKVRAVVELYRAQPQLRKAIIEEYKLILHKM